MWYKGGRELYIMKWFNETEKKKDRLQHQKMLLVAYKVYKQHKNQKLRMAT